MLNVLLSITHQKCYSYQASSTMLGNRLHLDSGMMRFRKQVLPFKSRHCIPFTSDMLHLDLAGLFWEREWRYGVQGL